MRASFGSLEIPSSSGTFTFSGRPILAHRAIDANDQMSQRNACGLPTDVLRDSLRMRIYRFTLESISASFFLYVKFITVL